MTIKIFGVHPVEELLLVAPESVQEIVTNRLGAKELKQVESLASAAGVRIKSVDADAVETLVERGNHQGVVAIASDFKYATLEDLVSDAPTACILILDQVQDPQNLGAILRAAAAFGVDGVVIPKDRAASVTGTVVRASSGQAYRVPIAQVTNVARTLDTLRSHGYWSVGTFMDGDQAAWDVDFKMKTALVMGGEGKGIRPLVEKGCDFRVRIPMQKQVESLNVAVATSIMLYEIQRQLA